MEAKRILWKLDKLSQLQTQVKISQLEISVLCFSASYSKQTHISSCIYVLAAIWKQTIAKFICNKHNYEKRQLSAHGIYNIHFTQWDLGQLCTGQLLTDDKTKFLKINVQNVLKLMFS